MHDDPYNLERFVNAQNAGGTYDRAARELKRGRKATHWMWFVFPQIAGLGMSVMSREFALSSVAEARAYHAHPVLGPRLRECAGIVAETEARSADRMLGPVDAMKLHSSMTLFAAADEGEADRSVFRTVLAKYFGGAPDEATVARLLSRQACSRTPARLAPATGRPVAAGRARAARAATSMTPAAARNATW
jgi:uncharacterized protein (DUF1810 family)